MMLKREERTDASSSIVEHFANRSQKSNTTDYSNGVMRGLIDEEDMFAWLCVSQEYLVWESKLFSSYKILIHCEKFMTRYVKN